MHADITAVKNKKYFFYFMIAYKYCVKPFKSFNFDNNKAADYREAQSILLGLWF